MSKVIAAIGTRQIQLAHPEAVMLFRLGCAAAGRFGHRLRTGAAPGFDQLAVETSLQYGGWCDLFLPWESYEKPWVQYIQQQSIQLWGENRIHIEVFDPTFQKFPHHEDWAESVRQYHPAPERLNQGAFKLHARNYGIIIDCSGPQDLLANCVLAVPSQEGGGTAQGMRIAIDLEVPMFDLSTQVGRDDLRECLKLGNRTQMPALPMPEVPSPVMVPT
jgi:hypothetical protein